MPEPALLQALRSIAPAGAGCGWADPRQDYGLLAGEALPGAVPSRLKEFSAGRAAARTAMAELGVPSVAIPHGADRAPIWPDGVIGSIAHTGVDCLSVVVQSPALRGIGIDLEPQMGLGRDLWPTVLTKLEKAAITRVPDCRQPDLALVHFAAKEAAYKAQYPLTRTILDFHDLALTFASGGFQACFERDVKGVTMGTVIHGRVKVAEGHVLAIAWL